MTEPGPNTSALFGPDGTQLPDPSSVPSDPLGGQLHGAAPDTPSSLPAAPDMNALREAMSATFAAGMDSEEELVGPVPTVDPALAVDPAPAADPAAPPPPGGPPPLPMPAGPATSPLPAAAPPPALPPAEVDPGADGNPTVNWLPPRSHGAMQTGYMIAVIILGAILLSVLAVVVEALAGLFR